MGNDIDDMIFGDDEDLPSERFKNGACFTLRSFNSCQIKFKTFFTLLSDHKSAHILILAESAP